MTRWGEEVSSRLQLSGDEGVLDAGCGSGRVTERLAERLPFGRVVAVDASPEMIERAGRRLARFGDRVQLVVADLAKPLPIDGAVDAVFSNATFHWVLDHDALFANLAAVLRSGGRLLAQCGGGATGVLPWGGRPPRGADARLRQAQHPRSKILKARPILRLNLGPEAGGSSGREPDGSAVQYLP